MPSIITHMENIGVEKFLVSDSKELKPMNVFALVLVGALAFLTVLSISTKPAQAQTGFVCGGLLDRANPDQDEVASFGGAALGYGFACGQNATSSGNGTAVGPAANATGFNNTAVGILSNASGSNGSNVAVGDGSNASGADGSNVAVGNLSNSLGDDSVNISIGNSANSSGASSGNIAIGADTDAQGSNFSRNTAVGTQAVATGTNSSAFGGQSSATGSNATAIGNGAAANHAGAAAFGSGATTTRANQQVFGTATTTYTAPGITSAASTAAQGAVTGVVTTDANGNLASTDITSLQAWQAVTTLQKQVDTNTENIKSVAAGTVAALAGSNTSTLAIGDGAVASAVRAIAIGDGAQATNDDSVCIGTNSKCSGSTAVGGGAQATGVNSAAYGVSAAATGNGSTSIGEFSKASGANTVALGDNASATHTNSIAIGSSAATTRANQVIVGNASNTHTLSGIASTASRAAQSGPVEVVTSDASGNLATLSLDALNSGVSNARNNRQDRDISRNTEGIALALALEDPDLFGNQSFAIRANYGTFEGKNAFGVTAVGIVGRNILGGRNMVALSGGVGLGLANNRVGGRVGMQLGW